jgi:hypothetical membrane protein
MPHTVMAPAHAVPQSRTVRDPIVTLLARFSIAGIAMYVILDVLAQLLPPHYSPIRQAESDLAVGPNGYVMTINFVVRGLLSIGVTAALYRVLTPTRRSQIGLVLLGVWAVGALLLAIFPTDVGTSEHSVHGKIHLLIAIVAFIGIALAAHTLSRCLLEEDRVAPFWGAIPVVATCTWVALVVLVLSAKVPKIGGLTERLFLACALLWLLLVALQLLRQPEPGELVNSGRWMRPT